ncbi:M23 family metallopeptidase [Anaerovorax sp. IOR16]|uniref:M23 family metallopeptidase n=1 Tax=Anaerovorax sp. IOR16 TaxID=2773458 RepID=UPI0019D1BF00|nr:M23 family metallopeptidase [Anaerovorax sp. IOR16]
MIVFDHLPVIPIRVTSKYGTRQTGIRGATTNHKGIDLGRNRSTLDTPIFSVSSGKVSNNYWNAYRGWVLIINHGNYKTLYQHLKQQSPLKKGQKVVAGQRIGLMGNSSDKTKLSVSTHLHFELIINGLQVDPQPYLENIKGVDDVTREEVIAIVKEILKGNGDLPSSWAKERWEQSIADGIVTGVGPRKYATKEEVAFMIQLSKTEKW